MKNEDGIPSAAAEIRAAVQTRYRAVAQNPSGHFSYPVGRESALNLGYAPDWLEAIPSEIVDRFVGVGNPFCIRRPARGERVLDVGCGCGLDTFVAALLVGPQGRAVGLDLTPEMLARPRQAAARAGLSNLEFVEGSAEKLPFTDGSFDMAISNGALNLVPDKDAAFAEICRVLRPGGVLATADLLVRQTIPAEILADMDAWSG
jgi:arsenite methyltransferase